MEQEPDGAIGIPQPIDGRRGRWPALDRLFDKRWVVRQTALPAEDRSPLFSWLGGEDTTESAEFCQAMSDAIRALAGVVGATDRIDRLKGPASEFWSALCELYMAAHLTTSGLPAALDPGTPDLRVRTPTGGLGIELTAGFPTLRFLQLQAAVTDAWSQPGRLIMVCPDETHGFLSTERDALVARLESVDLGSLRPPPVVEEDRLHDGDYIYGGVVFAREDVLVPIDDIIDPARLSVLIGPAPYAVVVVRSGARFGYQDPWPRVLRSVHEKARKLSRSEPSLVAFEAGHMHTSSRIWADLVRRGEFALTMSLPEAVAGTLIYWQDARFHKPVSPLHVWNPLYVGARAPVEATLEALGADVVSAVPEPERARGQLRSRPAKQVERCCRTADPDNADADRR